MATASLRCLEMKRVPVVVAPGSSTLIRAAHGMVVRRAGTTQGGWGRRLARSRGEYEEEELSTTAGALIVGVILFVLAFALAIHHWCIHKDAPPEDGTLPFLLVSWICRMVSLCRSRFANAINVDSSRKI